jgi:hypothetical protein
MKRLLLKKSCSWQHLARFGIILRANGTLQQLMEDEAAPNRGPPSPDLPLAKRLRAEEPQQQQLEDQQQDLVGPGPSSQQLATPEVYDQKCDGCEQKRSLKAYSCRGWYAPGDSCCPACGELAKSKAIAQMFRLASAPADAELNYSYRTYQQMAVHAASQTQQLRKASRSACNAQRKVASITSSLSQHKHSVNVAYYLHP